jgi:hypothetical protein
MKPTEPEPQVELQKEEPKQCVAAGASSVNQITLEPVNDSDGDGGEQFSFDADTESNADEEVAEEPAEPEVEREKTPEEPAQLEPEEVELDEPAEPEVEREKTPEEPAQPVARRDGARRGAGATI